MWILADAGAPGLRLRGRRYCLDAAKVGDDRAAREGGRGGVCVSVCVCREIVKPESLNVCVQPFHHLQPTATYHPPSGPWRTDGGGT